eukprot:CAMPEP_0184681958 /NCGR_PEP_ID=MMETSP0312-20130426/5050_1 /TAXON_ID=31354 /ORGANISM="Compsopogon coeruleus, Strain SAG 36.94" /LENGTH=213 /DNA_ID=CAMNT_0027133121 /DNA_START=479 /DNA_END=1120 /DNA_ORIENTATION=+
MALTRYFFLLKRNEEIKVEWTLSSKENLICCIREKVENSKSLLEALNLAVHLVCVKWDWPLGEIWSKEDDSDEYLRRSSSYIPQFIETGRRKILEEFESYSRSFHCPIVSSLIGRTYSLGQGEWSANLLDSVAFDDRANFSGTQLMKVAFTAEARHPTGNVGAVLVWYSDVNVAYNPQLIYNASAMATAIASSWVDKNPSDIYPPPTLSDETR